MKQSPSGVWIPPPKKKFEYKKDILKTLKSEATEYVKIKYLPPTVHPEDIRKLVREGLSDNLILDIAFPRNQYFQLKGQCVIQLSSKTEAKRFVEKSRDKFVGGNQIKLEFVGSKGGESYEVMKQFRPLEMQFASGRSVILSGFPVEMRPEDLRNYLKREGIYVVDASADGITELKISEHAFAKKFLVKLATENNAYYIVRRLNGHRLRMRQSIFIKASVAY